MATTPLWTGTPNIGQGVWTSSTTANTKSDGTGTIGTDMLKILTAGGNGSFVNKVRLMPCASAAATATTATVARIYLSTVGSGSTARTDTNLIAEVPCPAQTADQTTTATNQIDIPLGFAIASGDYILFSMHHAAAANTSWSIVGFAGDF